MPPLAEALGGPLWLARLEELSVAGLVASGLGVMTASSLVMSSLGGRRGPLWIAALAAIPFGLLLVLGGLAALAPLSTFADMVDRAGPLVLALGVVVVVALGLGFAKAARRE